MLRQHTPEAPASPVAFSVSPHCMVCLPVFNESNRLVWLHSNQIDLQPDGVAELDKAFDRDPYLTPRQTAALALRCSLHPDQVKIWFMAQRLHYGISWDPKDTHKIWKKLKSCRRNAQRKELQQSRMEGDGKKDGIKDKQKRKGKNLGGKEEQDEKEGGLTEENEKAEEQLEGKKKQEQPMMKQVDEENSSGVIKRKRMTVAEEVGKKRVKQGYEGMMARAGKEKVKSAEVEKSTQPRTKQKQKKTKVNKGLLPIQEHPAYKSVGLPDAPLDASCTSNIGPAPVTSSLKGGTEMEPGFKGEMHKEATKYNATIAGVSKLMELKDVSSRLGVPGAPPSFAQKQDSCKPPAQTRGSAKTESQLAMLRTAFLQCTYPDSECYSKLAEMIGIPRHVLVQWFTDMRYHIKKVKPRWMNKEQHSQVLASIKYQQYMSVVAKMQLCEGGKWELKPKSKNCNEEA